MQNTSKTVALNAASKVGSRKRHLFITNRNKKRRNYDDKTI